MTVAVVPGLGLMNQMWAQPAIGDREFIRTAIDEIRLADELGYDSVWIGEHHLVKPNMQYYGRIPASELFLSHVAALAPRIQVGTGVKILSSTTAQRAAEEMSLLHLLTDGRAQFGLGMGGTDSAAPVSREEKIAQFQVLLDDILRFLTADRSTGLPVIAPTASPDILGKIWIAARHMPTIEIAARRGLNFVVGQAEIASRQAPYVRHFKESGATGRAKGVRLAFVAETTREAVEQSEAAVRITYSQSAGRNYHLQAVQAGALPETATSLEEMRRQMSFIVGTPDEVALQINAYIAETGVDQIDVMVQIPGVPTDMVKRSMRLIRDEVYPQLRFGTRSH